MQLHNGKRFEIEIKAFDKRGDAIPIEGGEVTDPLLTLRTTNPAGEALPPGRFHVIPAEEFDGQPVTVPFVFQSNGGKVVVAFEDVLLLAGDVASSEGTIVGGAEVDDV
jgi:hypothetical protein